MTHVVGYIIVFVSLTAGTPRLVQFSEGAVGQPPAISATLGAINANKQTQNNPMTRLFQQSAKRAQ